MARAISVRTGLIEDDERYGHLSSLRPLFVTKVKGRIDTVSLLTVKTISADLHICTFTAQKNIIIKRTCL